MTTHLTKIWWDLNKHRLVEQAIPEAEIYKREWVGLTDEEELMIGVATGMTAVAIRMIEAKLKEKNT
jgi:hypothetical protein